MPHQTKAQGPYSTFSVINPGPGSWTGKWSAETPYSEIGTSNFTFHNSTTAVGSTFFVNVTVSNVTAMKAWGVGLVYDNTTLQYVSAHRPADHVFSITEINDGTSMVAPAVDIADFDATHQEVIWGCSYIMPDPPFTFNGTGVMCQIEFRIIAPINDTQWTSQFTFDPGWNGVYFHPTGQENPPNLTTGLVTYTTVIPEYTTVVMLALLAMATVAIVVAKKRSKRELST